MLSPKLWIKFLRTFVIFLIIFTWIFSGWPRIWGNPLESEAVYATEVNATTTIETTATTTITTFTTAETTATTTAAATTEKIIEPHEEVGGLANSLAATPPDFSSDTIKEIKGAVLSATIIQIERSGQNELWLFDIESGRQENIGLETSVADDSPIGLKGEFVFWLSQDKHTLFAFNPESKILLQKPVPAFDPAKGERARINFSEIPWEVIVGTDDFYFFSEKTGEVFSDGNSEVLESFRRKFSLDSSLTKEELSNLSFSVEENE